MALIWKDRVAEISTTTGTGALTLAGALTSYRAFSSVCATNDTVYYAITAVGNGGEPTGDWETGLGTYSGSNTLTRTTVLDSSNAGAAVNFAAGTKRVVLSQIAQTAGRTTLFAASPDGGASTSLFAGKGGVLTPWNDITVTQIVQYINVPASGQYRAYVVELNSSDVVQSILASSATITPSSSGIQFVTFPLTTEASLAALTRYALLVYLTNNTTTTSSGARAGAGVMNPVANSSGDLYARHAALSPSVSDTIGTGTSGGVYCMGFKYSTRVE